MENSMEKKNKLHYGWVMCFVGFVYFFLAMCILSNCVGLFVKPVSEDFGISRQAFSLTTTFYSGAGMIVSIFAGRIIKKFGLRKLLIASSVRVPLLYACYSVAPVIQVFYVIAFFCGIGGIFLGSLGVSTLLNSWFTEKRGTAIAVAATGSGIGGIIMNPFIGKLITRYGFRKTYLILAVLMAAVIIPCTVLLVREKPRDMGLEPYGGLPKTDAGSGEIRGMTMAEAMKSPMLYMLVPVYMIVSASCTCVMQHTVAYVTDLGYEYSFAAGIASVVTASLAAGKLIMGAAFDRIGSQKSATISLGAFALSFTLYNFARSLPILYIATGIVGFGLSFSTVAYSVLVQDIFGKRDYASIYGKLTVASALGGALGSPLIARVYDSMGSYRLAWTVLAVLAVVNIVIVNAVFVYKKRHETDTAGA